MRLLLVLAALIALPSQAAKFTVGVRVVRSLSLRTVGERMTAVTVSGAIDLASAQPEAVSVVRTADLTVVTVQADAVAR